MNLDQFIAQARGGKFSSRLSEIIEKADDPLLTTDFYYAAYSQKVWDALNSTPYLFNLLRHVPFGRPGWRTRGTRHTSSPLTEGASIPDFNSVAPTQYHSKPRTVVTPFAVTTESEFLSGSEYGMGDALAVELELAGVDHLHTINSFLTKNSTAVCTTAGASGVAVLAPFGCFNPGDTFFGTGVSAGIYTVISHNPVTGVLAYSGAVGSLVAGRSYVARSRAAMTSIDDVVESATVVHPGTLPSFVLAYDMVDRNGINGSFVSGNAGTHRALTLALLDTAIAQSRRNGGNPDVIYTTPEQVDKIGYLIGTNNYLVAHGEFTKKVGMTETLPGGDGGLRFAMYKGLALVGDPNAPVSVTSAGALGGGKVFVLDTNFLEIATARMSRYTESRDFIANHALVLKGMFDTSIELRCYNIAAQSKIVDLLP